MLAYTSLKIIQIHPKSCGRWQWEVQFDDSLLGTGHGFKVDWGDKCTDEFLTYSIHDHTDSHCFVKVLEGNLLESRFAWPEGDDKEGPMAETGSELYKLNGVTYISGTLNLNYFLNIQLIHFQNV